ncbi:MAG TPA: short-chain dehydrogenase [Acidimicrobiaceae bacterium]|jgi:3-oxoacyl-[acyl-carrier protein] reductase|nr:short-chain dehydrogenase [Acidimicrobiaceae bacterium]HCH79484.1 short-chain dehydrogenase [Acidimicrobiaceae bacterium]
MTSPVALVTGGGGGIGSAISRRLASDGMRVLVGYRASVDRADRVVSELTGEGHRALQVPVDDSEALAAVAAAVASTEGRIDALVNCAGVTRPVAHDDLDALDDDLIDQIFVTNWRGPFATIRAFRSLLEAAPDPIIVNISSVAGITGQGSNVAYCASKAALDSMTRSLGRALAPSIRIMSVSPGWVMGDYAARMPEDVIAAQRDATPLRRLATGDDVAAAVSAVIRDLPCSTGSIVNVDGGRPLGVA